MQQSSFTSILNSTNIVDHVGGYVESLQIAYDNMTLPRIGLRIDEIGDCIDSQIKVNSELTSLKCNNTIKTMSTKINGISDYISSKIENRNFKEEKLQENVPQPTLQKNIESPNNEEKKEKPIITFP